MPRLMRRSSMPSVRSSPGNGFAAIPAIARPPGQAPQRCRAGLHRARMSSGSSLSSRRIWEFPTQGRCGAATPMLTF